MKSATEVMVSTFGVIAGLAGIEHGVGEILQGNHTPDSLVFPSWPGSLFFDILAGEPAMSIIPNFLVSGILAILFSLIFMLCATLFAQRKNTSLVLVLISIILLLVGGGFGPPLLGMIIATAGKQIHAPWNGWHTHFSSGFRKIIKRLWPWFFGASITVWLLLFPGISILAYFFRVNNPGLVLLIVSLAFGLLLLTIFSGFLDDSDSRAIILNN